MLHSILLTLALAAAPVVSDSPQAATANRSAIEASLGTVTLPAGVVHLDQALVLTGKHSGTTIVGQGTTLRSTLAAGQYIERGALSIRDTSAYSFYEPRPLTEFLPAGQVAWLFNSTGNGWFYQGAVERLLPGDRIPQDTRSFMRGFKAVPFANADIGVMVLKTPQGHPFAVGETVLLTDGPLINELKTEYCKIRATTTETIEIETKTTRAYRQGAIVGGNWPQNITFRGITFDGNMGPAFLGPCVDCTFIDCTFAKNAFFPGHAGWLTISGCARLNFIRCNIACGMTITSSHDLLFRDCQFPLLICEQGVRRVTFDGGTVGEHYFDARVETKDFTVRGLTFNGTKSIGFYDGYQVSDCKIVGQGLTVNIRGGQSKINNLVSDSPINVQAAYQGSPVGSGRNVSLTNVSSPYILLAGGTSGTISGRPVPVLGVTTEWQLNKTQEGLK